jgi:glycosyltransferase involved in cell wall biosynthesis
MVTKLKDLKVSILIANYNNEKFLKECWEFVCQKNVF